MVGSEHHGKADLASTLPRRLVQIGDLIERVFRARVQRRWLIFNKGTGTKALQVTRVECVINQTDGSISTSLGLLDAIRGLRHVAEAKLAGFERRRTLIHRWSLVIYHACVLQVVANLSTIVARKIRLLRVYTRLFNDILMDVDRLASILPWNHIWQGSIRDQVICFATLHNHGHWVHQLTLLYTLLKFTRTRCDRYFVLCRHRHSIVECIFSWLVSKVDRGNLGWYKRCIWVTLLILFDWSAEIVGITPYLARLVLLKVLIELIIWGGQHLFLLGFFSIWIRLGDGTRHDSLASGSGFS